MIFFLILHHVLFDDDVALDNTAIGLGVCVPASYFIPAVNLATLNPILQTILFVLSILFVGARFTHWIIRRVRGERSDTSGL